MGGGHSLTLCKGLAGKRVLFSNDRGSQSGVHSSVDVSWEGVGVKRGGQWNEHTIAEGCENTQG